MKKLEPLLEDISAKLFLRLRDEETSVQELAFKTLQDIYFSNNSLWDDTTKESKVDLERKLYILIASARANRALVPIFFEFIEKATDKGTTHENDMDKIVRTIMSMIASLSTSTEESDLVRLISRNVSYYFSTQWNVAFCFYLKLARSFHIILFAIYQRCTHYSLSSRGIRKIL